MANNRVNELKSRLKPLLNQIISKYKAGQSAYEYLSLIDQAVGVAMSVADLFSDKLSGEEKKAFVLVGFQEAYTDLQQLPKFDLPDWLDKILLDVLIPEAVERLWHLANTQKLPPAKTVEVEVIKEVFVEVKPTKAKKALPKETEKPDGDNSPSGTEEGTK